MNSPHPSPPGVAPTRVIACYRRSAVEPASQTVSEQAAHLAAWIAKHGIAYEILLDTDDAGPHPAPTPRDLSTGPVTSPAPVRTPQP